ncbi:MAG: RimK family alpha-L-glutamate ligase [Planctomycetota bacterium]|jgi:ribosomal protein S6--L-glutamate ligase|nr:RimK family alpha-L-glutamate ligase [Planctomycetota bacterium]
MRIAILSRSPRCYSTRRLREACVAAGYEVKVLDTLRFGIEVQEGEPKLSFRGKRLRDYDAVIPRIGASMTFFGTAVVRQFEQMGVYCVNPSHAISVSRDKLRSIQVLSRHRIGFPTTVFAKDKQAVMAALTRVGTPAIIKLLEGTQGIGVILADNRKMAEAVMEALQEGAKQNVLVQSFVAESRGRDIRALVVGDRVIAAMRRSAVGDEFRSNVHRGGTVENIEIDEEYQRCAVHAAQIMGLRFAGVDMLEGPDGPLVLEVNSSPGLEGIERATGVDVAQAVVQLIAEEVLLPEIDIRQRLSLRNGYGVTEFPILPNSELAGKTIQQTGLRDRDVIVLSITRDSVTIPNPRSDRELYAGDSLLCYGKLITLRGLVPPPKPRKTKKVKTRIKPERAIDSETPGD